MAVNPVRYRVYLTPILDLVAGTYDSEIEISDRVEIGGIGSISKSLDSSDYDFGVYVFSDLELVGYNHNGYFNNGFDTRSVFNETRDRSKVRIEFEDSDGTTITFRGIINEEATRIDIVNDSIKFKVLSRDSIFRKTNISGGLITNGVTTTSAMYSMLNIPEITSILNVDVLNINPAQSFTIDDGSKFSNKSVKEMLNKLLLITNSVMTITDAGDLIIRSRTEDDTRPIVLLYGKSDVHGRENIIKINSYNTGLHRMFTSVDVDGTESSNATYVSVYGFRQKKLEMDFITDVTTRASIGAALVDEFKIPKIELDCLVSTKLAKSIELLDRVSVNYPLRLKPYEGSFLPVVGVTKIDETAYKLPYKFGSIDISPNIAFKVIQIDENPKDFTSVLKLRQAGSEYADGYFTRPDSCIIGYAVVGSAPICDTGTACDGFEIGLIGGGATIGCTLIA